MRVLKMVKMSKKGLKTLATSLNAVDLTHDCERRKGLGHLTKIAYSVGVYGCNGFILKSDNYKLYIVAERSTALLIYGI